MKIIIAGGTGFIGKHLAKYLLGQGHSLIVLSRNPQSQHYPPNESYRELFWDGHEPEPWSTGCAGADVVINLSGASIADRRWSPKRKQELIDSRVDTTKALLQAITRWKNTPQTFITASGIGFYGDTGSKNVDEQTPAGTGFLGDLSQKWEQAAQEGESLGMRVVQIRFGMVLGLNGGALPKMKLPFQWFVGGPILPGTQYVSWIHIEDLVKMIHWCMNETSLHGPINGVSPSPVTMKEFCAVLGRTMNRPSLFPVPGFVLKVALGELSDMLTTGQRVIPQRAIESGFTFSYPELSQALDNVFHARSIGKDGKR